MDTSDSASSTRGGNTAMSLWKHLSDMQDALEAACAERIAAENQIAMLEGEITSLKSEQDEYQHSTTEFKKKTTTFHNKIGDLSTQYHSLILPAQRSVQLEKEAIEAQKSRSDVSRTITLQNFVEESKEFRSQCNRLRIAATAVGLDHAGERAYLYAVGKGDDNHESVALYDMLDDSVMIDPNLDHEDEEDPTKWIIPDGDHELQDSHKQYLAKKLEYELAAHELQVFTKAKEQVATDVNDREERKNRLKAQLERIENDNTAIEENISEANQDTEEAESMVKSYSQKISSGKQHSGSGSGRRRSDDGLPSRQQTKDIHGGKEFPARNPYVATTSATRTSSCPGIRSSSASRVPVVQGGSSRRQELRSVVLGSATSTLMNHQQPHRVTGRPLRRNKQFGCNFEITGGHTMGDGIELETGDQDQLPFRDQNESADRMNGVDGDDDDNDPLLSFDPFSK